MRIEGSASWSDYVTLWSKSQKIGPADVAWTPDGTVALARVEDDYLLSYSSLSDLP